MGGPITFSFFSSLVTSLLLLPFSLKAVPRAVLTDARFWGVCVLVCVDLVFTNVSLSLIDLSLQQCIKALLPVITVIVHACRGNECPRLVTRVRLFGLSLGAMLLSGHTEGKLWGIMAMVVAVTASAAKNVVAYDAMKSFKCEANVVVFTFWMDLVLTVLIAPFAIASGETVPMTSDQVPLFLFTAALGGVRVVSQFVFLSQTSATSAGVANVFVQIFTVALGVIVFAEPRTPLFGLGVSLSVVFALLHAGDTHNYNRV